MGTTGIDLKLRLSLREGTVYYFTHHSLTSPEPHYFTTGRILVAEYQLVADSVLWNLQG